MSAPGWIISPALSLAHVQATLSLLNAGSEPGYFRIYASARPDTATDPGGHMGAITLAKPAGTIVNGVLKLKAAAGDPPMVTSNGIPRWALLFAGDGTPLANGKVTDADGDGEIVLAGGVTPEGDNSPQLYAGGRIVLLETFLT